MPDQTPDYSEYSLEQLEYALRHTNYETDPVQFRQIEAEIQKRQTGPINSNRRSDPKKRHAILAFILSFFAPGLGHLYSGAVKRGAILLAAELLIDSLFVVATIRFAAVFFLSFPGLLSFCGVGLSFLCFHIYIAVDAAARCRRVRELRLRAYNRWYVYAGVLLAFHISSVLTDYTVPDIRTEIRKVAQAYQITSSSMEPALMVGDHILCDKGYFLSHLPKTGDLVIFKYPLDTSKHFAKRIMATEGQTIEIRDKVVYINGRKIRDPWGHHADSKILPADQSPRDTLGPVTVPKGLVFVLGDNRDRSLDSRFFGLIENKYIAAKPLYIYWAKNRTRIGTSVN